jgi:hypothetical protein
LSDERRQARWLMAMAVVAWAAVALPLAFGSRTLYLRDVRSVHAPWKAFGAEALRQGSIPAFNPTWGLGQPFRGNPNALPFYPDNVLFLVLPFWIAFNLHYALHWLLALFTFRALGRALGMRELGAALAALTYAGSGYVLSCLSFYNLIAFAAWWPLVMWGAVTGGRRGISVGGLACGLALYAGEPVTLALGLVPLALAVQGRRGWRGLRGAAAILALGIALALPQLVAAARIAGFTFRGGHGLLPSQAASFSLHPLRWLELLLPLPFGSPAYVGARGWWATEIAPAPPLFYSLYVGCVGLWLALLDRGRRAWLALAAAGLLLAWLLGRSGASLVAWSAGLFRYPEKLLFWPAVALPLLAGWGLDRLSEEHRRAVRAAVAMAIGAGSILGLALATRPFLLAAAKTPDATLAARQISAGWIGALGLAVVLLAVSAWGARRERRGTIAVLQLVALLQLHSLAATAPAAVLGRPVEWAADLSSGDGIVNPAMVYPRWQQLEFTLGNGPAWKRAEIERQALAPWAGVPLGWHFPLAPDIEGSQSPLHSLVLFNLPKFDLAQRLRWLRILGTDRLVQFEEIEKPGDRGMVLRARADWAGTESRLYELQGVQPRASWPARVELGANPAAVLRTVTFGGEDPVTTAVVPQAVVQRAGGAVELLSETPSRLDLRSHGPGGLVVVRRGYQPLYQARADGARLDTVPVNLVLLGVVVPPGDRTVTIDVAAWPEWAAAGVAIPMALAALWFARRERGV